jgi:dTDP-4-amino-4,6-dideoxygalactose transaminase
LELPIERGYVDTNWHLFPVRVSPNQRREVFEKLRANGIGVQVNYIPAYRHPVFDKYQIDRNKFPVSENFYSREISLPFYTDLSNSNIDFIIESIKSLYLKI